MLFMLIVIKPGVTITIYKSQVIPKRVIDLKPSIAACNEVETIGC